MSEGHGASSLTCASGWNAPTRRSNETEVPQIVTKLCEGRVKFEIFFDPGTESFHSVFQGVKQEFLMKSRTRDCCFNPTPLRNRGT